uniref:Uncharacterized protein n=1 Tax=Anguilla anguilla TaxID=7936 RepID=A0A0E9VWK8_ANGAN
MSARGAEAFLVWKRRQPRGERKAFTL